MPYTYTHTIYLNVGSTEMPVEIQYTVEPGFAGDRIDPPEPPSAEIQSIQIVVKGEKHDCPKWLFDLLDADDGVHNDMLLEAGEDKAAWADERDEMRREAT